MACPDAPSCDVKLARPGHSTFQVGQQTPRYCKAREIATGGSLPLELIAAPAVLLVIPAAAPPFLVILAGAPPFLVIPAAALSCHPGRSAVPSCHPGRSVAESRDLQVGCFDGL